MEHLIVGIKVGYGVVCCHVRIVFFRKFWVVWIAASAYESRETI